jgi:hypothetical protein
MHHRQGCTIGRPISPLHIFEYLARRKTPTIHFRCKLLAEAYQKTGHSSEAHRTTETLANFNDPTVEQALVVPAFRKCYQDPSCNSNFKGVSLKKSFPRTF